MRRKLPSELLFDSASSLRSAASLLGELHVSSAGDSSTVEQVLPADLLLRVYVDVCGFLELVDRGRAALDVKRSGESPDAEALRASLERGDACLETLDGRVRETVALLERQLLCTDSADRRSQER